MLIPLSSNLTERKVCECGRKLFNGKIGDFVLNVVIEEVGENMSRHKKLRI